MPHSQRVQESGLHLQNCWTPPPHCCHVPAKGSTLFMLYSDMNLLQWTWLTCKCSSKHDPSSEVVSVMNTRMTGSGSNKNYPAGDHVSSGASPAAARVQQSLDGQPESHLVWSFIDMSATLLRKHGTAQPPLSHSLLLDEGHNLTSSSGLEASVEFHMPQACMWLTWLCSRCSSFECTHMRCCRCWRPICSASVGKAEWRPVRPTNLCCWG